MGNDEVLIRFEDVRFGYPARDELFSGITLALHRGERVGIVGRNGSGKTTLYHLIMGLETPSAGRIEVMGRTVRTPADHGFVRRRIGFLFQNSDDQLFCPTVAEDVAFGPLNLGKTREEAEAIVQETLAGLGLADYGGRITYQLSGGEKRLVALATVLAMDPEVLLLDEPESGLDPEATRELIALLDRISGTQVVSSHDLEFVRSTCLRVLVVHDGRLLAEGPTDEILGDDELMLKHGLEVPYSITAEREQRVDHHHGTGPGHGHGHRGRHYVDQHVESSDDAPAD